MTPRAKHPWRSMIHAAALDASQSAPRGPVIGPKRKVLKHRKVPR